MKNIIMIFQNCDTTPKPVDHYTKLGKGVGEKKSLEESITVSSTPKASVHTSLHPRKSSIGYQDMIMGAKLIPSNGID